MHENLTSEQIEFLEHFYDPTSLTECLIPINFNSPQTWNANCDTIFWNNSIDMGARFRSPRRWG